MSVLSRREFLAASVASTCALLRPDQTKLDVAFFLVGDTHYLADPKKPDQLDERSGPTNARLIDQLNRLPGTAIPDVAGGGAVATPRGVIHAGDLIDSGDKNGGAYPKMQQTELAAYLADYGLTGKDGRLTYPVYEIHGNHDGPQGDGIVVQKIIERNKNRTGCSVSKNGLHYSWDWGTVHFVNLGIVVGAVKGVARKRHYNPLDSLDFLAADLADKVGKSGRPVILTHHVDVARYSTPPDPDGPATNKEWDPCDVHGYYEAIKGYNIAAILYGHTHVRDVFAWDGTAVKAAEGLSVFNVEKSAHFAGEHHAFFYFHLRDGETTVRECFSTDRWKTADWTPRVWTTTLKQG